MVIENMFKTAQQIMNPKIAEEEDELERKRKLKGALLFRGEKELIRIFHETDPNIVYFKETDVDDKFDYVEETELANGKFRYRVIPGEIRFSRSDDKYYTIKIPRLENGNKSDKHFDIVTLNKNGELIDMKLADKGVMQLDSAWLKELSVAKGDKDATEEKEALKDNKKAIGKHGRMLKGSIEATGISKAKGDGNCGFRAILGGKFLDGEYDRKTIVDDIKRCLNNKEVKKLVGNDIKALYNEWVADSTKVKLPESLQGTFDKMHKGSEEAYTKTKDLTKYEKKISALFDKNIFKNPHIARDYLNDYLIDSNHWPHPQGSLLAFAEIKGFKLHCWQQEKGALHLLDGTGNQKGQYRNGDVHILFNGRDHFDRLEVKPYVPSKFLAREEARREAAAIAPRGIE